MGSFFESSMTEQASAEIVDGTGGTTSRPVVDPASNARSSSPNDNGRGGSGGMRLTIAVPADRPFAADRVSNGWSVAILGAALLLTFQLDRTTGSAPVQHLFYVPIIFAAVRFGMRGGLALAACAIVLYHVANPHLLSFRYEEVDLVQVTIFGAVGLVSAKLTDDARRLHRLAMTDDLTGLHNLRSFEARLRSMVSAEADTGAPLSVLSLDLDDLKSLNDAHGHLAGAAAVRTVGHLIGARVPASAVACRYGGDEFVIALPACARPQALEFARELRSAVKALTPELAGIQFPAGRLSISIGVAGGERDGARISQSADEGRGEALFRAADAALYAAKRSGRDRVCEAEE